MFVTTLVTNREVIQGCLASVALLRGKEHGFHCPFRAGIPSQDRDEEGKNPAWSLGSRPKPSSSLSDVSDWS